MKRAVDALSKTTTPLGGWERPVEAADAKAIARVERVAHVAKGLDGLINVIAGMGTRRDKRTGSYYCRTQLTRWDYDEIFTSSGLARRIVTLPVGDMMRVGWTRIWDGSDKDDGVKAVERAEKNLQLKPKCYQGANWGRLYGGTAILMMLKGEKLDTPLNLNAVRRGSLQNLTVLDRWRISPSGKIDKDPNSPNFGEPLTYMIAESAVEVHWSRVVIFGGGLTPYFVKTRGLNQGWDDSVLQPVIETVKNFDGSEAAAASMIYEASTDIHFMEGLVEMLSKPGGEAKVEQRLLTAQMSKGVWKTLVLDGGKNGQGGDKYERKEMTFAGVEKIMDRLALSVCVSAGMPLTTLFGDSPGGLNSTGEHSQQNWDDTVDAMRDTYLAPALDRIDEVFIRSTLGRMPENYVREFKPLRQVDPDQEAKNAFQWAQADKIYFDIGAITASGIARENQARGIYRTQEDADIKLIEEMEKKALEKPPEPAPVPPKKGAPPADDPNADPAA